MIECRNIVKTYRVRKRPAGFGNAVRALFSRGYETVRALNGIDLTIRDGEMVGYIGPNGAGKSTTIKILCGILTPDSGECVIDGRTPWKDRKRHVAGIGVVFGQRSQLWWDVPVIDSFEILRDMYRVDGARYQKNLDELTALLDLSEILKTPARNLSLGQRMRAEIAASLLHEPKTLFLDEPTIGLDAVSKLAVRRFIRRQNEERGTTVLLTTHDMQDVEALTERVMLIGKGKILLDGSLNDLKKHASGRKTMEIRYAGGAPALTAGMTLRESRERHLTVSLDPDALPVKDAIAYFAARAALTDVSVSDISAEEMVAALYKEYAL